VFLSLFFPGGTPKVIFHILKNPCLENEEGGDYERRSLAHGDYSRYFQLPEKNSCDISRYIYNILLHFKIIRICVYFTISVGTPNDVPRNPV
jgi:hypothetical protein